MAKIYTPNRGYTGKIAGVSFKNGKGETSNKWLIQWFRNKGYKIEKNKSVFHLTVAELKSLAKEKGITGYSSMIKDELIEVLGSE